MAGKLKTDCNKPDGEMELKTEKGCADLTCDLCEQDGLMKAAVAFCVECQDYLCIDCSMQHCRPKPMRHHRLLKEDEMPKKKAITSVSENCSYHTGEINKFYCENHDELCCHTCIATAHRTCDIKPLSEVTKDYITSEKYVDCKKELKAVEMLFRREIDIIEKNMESSRKSVEEALKELTNHRNDINKHFDQLEREIKDEAMNIQTEDSRKLYNLSKTCAATLAKIEEMNADLAVLEDTKQETQLFAALKCNKKQIGDINSELEKIQSESKVRLVKFCHNRTSTSMTIRKDLLGYLKISDREIEEGGTGSRGRDGKIEEKGEEEKEKIEEKVGLKEEKDVYLDDVSSSQDECPCNHCEAGKTHFNCKEFKEVVLPKMLHMCETIVAILDYHQNKISLHTKSDLNESTNIIFSSTPWDMTKVGENELAVTLPHEKKIIFLKVDVRIEAADEIAAPGFCRSIASVHDFLLVAFSEPAGLKLLSKSGEVLKDIPVTEDGKTLFRAPSSVVVVDRNIFITDPLMNTVTRMDSDGKIEEILRHKDLMNPSFVAYSNEKISVSLNKGQKYLTMTPNFKNIETENMNINYRFLGNARMIYENTAIFRCILFAPDEVEKSSDVVDYKPQRKSKKQCPVS